MRSNHCDVLIVGAGPVGLLLAHELKRHGIDSVRIIDRSPIPSMHSKAMGIQPRTLELLRMSGLYDAFDARGRRVHAIKPMSGGRVLATVDLASLESPTPWLLVLPQNETEGILSAALARQELTVERKTTLASFEQDSAGVDVTLQHDDGSVERCRTRWLIGCDGARSSVRQRLGLEFTGEDIGTHIAFLDARADYDVSTDEVALLLDGGGFCMCLPHPEKGIWRFIASVPKDVKVRHELDWYQDLFEQRLANPPKLHEALWMTDFVVRQRKVDRFRVGRVFLAGDAAHCHSPLGARGMNTGLQDAWNLSWKLALVLRGSGHPDLLDSYSLEREPIAASLLKEVGRNTRVATLSDPIRRAFRNTMMRIVTQSDAVRRRLALNATQLDIQYRTSPIVAEGRTRSVESEVGRSPQLSRSQRRTFKNGPRPGDRAPDAPVDAHGHAHTLHSLVGGFHHTLLLFTGTPHEGVVRPGLAALAGEIGAAFPELVRSYVVIAVDQDTDVPAEMAGPVLFDYGGVAHARYGAAGECIYVLRPDGHIGYRSQPGDLERLRDWLGSVLIAQEPEPERTARSRASPLVDAHALGPV